MCIITNLKKIIEIGEEHFNYLDDIYELSWHMN
jgi:hypothetical protein